MTISTTALAISDIFGERKGSSTSKSSEPKDEGLWKMAKQPIRCPFHSSLKKCLIVSLICLPHLSTFDSFSEVVRIKFYNLWYFLAFYFAFEKKSSYSLPTPKPFSVSFGSVDQRYSFGYRFDVSDRKMWCPVLGTFAPDFITTFAPVFVPVLLHLLCRLIIYTLSI